MMKICLSLLFAVALIFSQVTIVDAQAPPTVVENQVTSSSLHETSPTLGNDGTRDLVVYTARDLLYTEMFDQADIYYRYLDSNGQPDGPPLQVTAGLTDDVLNDFSGDYIVYTALDDTSSLTGNIMLYGINTGQIRVLADASLVHDPKISGHYVAWIQGGINAREVVLYDLNTNQSEILVSPTPNNFQVQIGSRFVIWSSLDGDYDVRVFDMELDMDYAITATATKDERYPATDGDWVAWETRDSTSPLGRIEVYNGRTGEMRIITVTDNTVRNRVPSLSGDTVCWESDVNGDFDVFCHLLPISETFQVTSAPGDQFLSDIYGDHVAYVDKRSGDDDIYVSTFTLCVSEGGDADVDRICDDYDNCLADYNPRQGDYDGDGIGNACDNCVASDNPDQADLDGDGIGNDCDSDADGDGYTIAGGDCDDLDRWSYPGNAETLCNGVDDNCNGNGDDDRNTDGDQVSFCNGDCNDNDALRYPGNIEVLCNGFDENCNGNGDDDRNSDGDPFSFCNGDCNDAIANIYPGAPETCDEVDNDCDSRIDEDFPIGDICYTGIGECRSAGYLTCSVSGETVCNATSGLPTEEICDNLDNDCNGLTDDSDNDGDGVLVCQDQCLEEDATGFDSNNDGCIDTLDGLTDVVTTLVEEDVIDSTMATSFKSKVENAQSKQDKDNICAAINQLEAFKNQVNGQAGKKISLEAAALLINYASNVINELLSNLAEGESC